MTALPADREGRAVRSFAWAVTSLGASRLIVFALTVVLARLLVPADFGLVAGGLALTALLEIGLDLGVGAALVYEQERGVTERVQTAFTLNLGIAAGCTLVGVAAAPLVADFFRASDQDALFRVLFLFLLLRGAGQVQDAVLRRDLRFRARTGAEILRALVRCAVSIPLALSGAGPWSIVLGILASELTWTATNWALVRFRPTFRLRRSIARSLLSFGLVALALKVISAVLANVDYLVVGGLFGPGPLGVYSIAYRLPELVLLNVLVAFSSVAFPVFAESRSSDPAALRPAMLRALTLVTLFGFPAGVGLAVVAADAVPVIFGPEWTGAVTPMVLVALALGTASVGFASGDIFPAVGRPGVLLRLDLLVAPVAVAAFVLVGSAHGLVGVAAVHLGLEVAYGGLRLALANRLLGSTTRESLAAMGPAVAAAVGVLGGALPLAAALAPSPAGLAATVAGGAAGGLVALRLLAPSALRELRRLATRGSAR